MEVILLENIRNLGKFGAKVKVAPGFGRNYLIPQGKAVPANAHHLAEFEARRSELEAAANDRLAAAEKRAKALEAVNLVIEARVAEEGKLYGSVGTHEVAHALTEQGVVVSRNEIRLSEGPIRQTGEFEVSIHLHAEVDVTVMVTVVAEKATA